MSSLEEFKKKTKLKDKSFNDQVKTLGQYFDKNMTEYGYDEESRNFAKQQFVFNNLSGDHDDEVLLNQYAEGDTVGFSPAKTFEDENVRDRRVFRGDDLNWAEKMLNRWSSDFGRLGSELATGYEQSTTQESLRHMTGLPVNVTEDPKETGWGVVRDIGRFAGDLPTLAMTRNPAMGMGVIGGMGSYNEVKREGRDYELSDVPKSALEVGKGALMGKLLQFGQLAGTAGGKQTGTLLEKLLKKDMTKVGEKAGHLTRPLADMALLEGTTFATEGRLATGRERLSNALLSGAFEGIGTAKGDFKDANSRNFKMPEEMAVKMPDDMVELDIIPKAKNKRAQESLYRMLDIDPNMPIPDNKKAVLEDYNKDGYRGNELIRIAEREGLDGEHARTTPVTRPKELSDTSKGIHDEYTKKGFSETEMIADAEGQRTYVADQLKKVEDVSGKKALTRVHEQLTRFINDVSGKVDNGNLVVTEAEVVPVINAKVVKNPSLSKRQTKNFSRYVRSMFGDDFFNLYIHPMYQGYRNMMVELKGKSTGIKQKRKQLKLSKKQMEEVGRFFVGEQVYKGDDGKPINSGRATLEAMGSKPVLEGHLRHGQRQMVDYINTEFKSAFDRINETRRRQGKNPLKPLNSEGGNYFPLFRRFSIAEKMGELGTKWNTHDFQKRTQKEGINNKHFLQRKKSQRAVELDPIRSYNQYMRSALNSIHMSSPTSLVRKVMKPFNVPEGMKEGFGKKVYDMKQDNPNAHFFLDRHIKFLEGRSDDIQRQRGNNPLLTKILRAGNNNIAMSILSFNLSSVINQTGAITGTISEFGTNYSMRGLKDSMSPSKIKFMMEHSNRMQTRMMDIHVDPVNDPRGVLGKTKKVVGDIGMKPMKVADAFSSATTWWTAFRYGESQGMGGRKLVQYADDAVGRIQGSANPVDLAYLQTHDYGKAMSIFQTFNINRFNWLMEDVLGIGRPDFQSFNFAGKKIKGRKKAKAMNMARFATTMGIYNTIANTLGEALPFDYNTPEQEPITVYIDKYNEKVANAEEKGESLTAGDYLEPLAWSIAEIATAIPIAGGTLKYGAEGMGGAYGKVMHNLLESMSARSKTSRRWGILLSSVGTISGMPGTNQIMKILIQRRKNIMKAMDEEYKEKKERRMANPDYIFNKAMKESGYNFNLDMEQEDDYDYTDFEKMLMGDVRRR